MHVRFLSGRWGVMRTRKTAPVAAGMRGTMTPMRTGAFWKGTSVSTCRWHSRLLAAGSRRCQSEALHYSDVLGSC